MKITAIIHSLDGGGAERVMAGLTTRLQQRGHIVTLITLDDGHHDRHEIGSEVQRVALNVMRHSRNKLSGLLNSGRRIWALRKAIEQSNPDVVLSFCDVTNLLTLLATRGLSLPVVISERSDPAQQSLPWPWSVARPKLFRRADDVVVLTQTAANTVAAWSKGPPTIIPSAVDRPPVLDRHHLFTRTEKILVGVGRLEIEKGFDRLIAAFARVASSFPKWQLRIIGDGSCRLALEQQAAALGLSTRIQFPGWLQPIWPSLRDADLFALTSRYEGFPSALLEAMATGVAVIAVDCESGPRAIIDNDVDGLLIANDEASIDVALERCMGNEALRHWLGKNATDVTMRFGWDAMVDAYEQRLRQVVLRHLQIP